MNSIKVALATKKDKDGLISYFKHYGIKEIIRNRVDCYTSHNFTVVAKDGADIIGVLQWHVKEDPRMGVVEFEEVHIKEGYRGRGICSELIKCSIWFVNVFFKKIKVKPRKIFLFVSKQNKIARKLYEKHGFKLVSDVGDLFSDNKTELFYILDL